MSRREIVVVVLLAVFVGWEIGIITAAPIERALPAPPPPPAPAKVLHLFNWQGGDLEVCECVPGRVEPGPNVRRKP